MYHKGRRHALFIRPRIYGGWYLDSGARLAALKRTGAFEVAENRTSRWSVVLDAEETVALYATYSNVTARPDRAAVLDEIGRVAREVFTNRVIRNMTTSMYIARRKD